MTEVRSAQGTAEVEAALELRRRVFCDEQGVALAADQDGLDREALHIVAVDERRVVGTCRLVFTGGAARLGRLAVEPERRGAGLGAALLAEAERAARARGAKLIRLHAQTLSRALYERGGFAVAGEEFLEEGIPHLPMEKAVA